MNLTKWYKGLVGPSTVGNGTHAQELPGGLR